MDRITKSLIIELLEKQEIVSEGDSKDLEKLVNYCILSNEYSKTFEIDVITVGEGGDTGIDGLAILVNGQLIEHKEEVDDLLERNNSLEVSYIFIQTKTSSSFSSGEINTFIFGIKDFFSESPSLVRNSDISRLAEISDYIYEKAPHFKENPTIKLYYCTTGKWVDDQNLLAVINQGKTDLEQANLFEEIFFNPYGAKEVARSFRKTKESIHTTLNFRNRVTLPSIKGISEAYIGLLPFEEFKKILLDEEDNLVSVFEDNVRDFQGTNNDVNNGIEKTLKNEDSDLFSVLNNGVTIVASSISTTGDNFTIRDYQIVNGCQTSNVLFNNRKGDYINNVNIPIKIIATDDDEIKNRITLATNNQTPIKKEQLASLTSFQRRLEQYYNSYSGNERLYYERRSKQYNSDNSVLKTRIITVPYQIKSFSAMFLNNPHTVTSFFGTIVNRLNEGKAQIFNADHKFSPYYTSAYAYYKLETCFRRKSIDPSYKKVRFHILMLFRIMFQEDRLPEFNSKKIDGYCADLLKILNDDNKALTCFNECIDVIDNAKFDKSDKQDIKLLSKTKVLIEEANNRSLASFF
ncbi:AIPR family protein [Acaryochloris sp. CCMEE 5410]|uniref:AIPR family protein n=1 Tax=Acaryochloris sp. CCMEE 5410 TaxID=310037 RepID=UPI0021CE24EB|nr:AIPR family protein [Acaryochloris sp. CCMEE 5410]KAI9129976.1 AIPR family protein [Acaryochloris sp. CCMEE 5410]